MTAAAEYITGALIVALIVTALGFVYRVYQAIRRHYRRVAQERATGWITVDALRTNTAPRTPAGPTHLTTRVSSADSSSPMRSPP